MPAPKGKGGKKLKFAEPDRPSAKATEGERQAAQARLEKYNSAINYLPRKRYPTTPVPISPQPTLREQDIIKKYRENRRKIREGPLYVHRVADSDARVRKSSPTSTFNSFTALQTWSSRYERKYRTRPSMDGKLWLKEFLPEELWDVVDPTVRAAKATKKADKSSATTARFNINEFSDNEDAEKDEDAEAESDAEPNAGGSEVDEDWMADEDEDYDNDYNAEGYFDNGEDDDVVGDDVEAMDDMGGGPHEQEREFQPDEEFDVY